MAAPVAQAPDPLVEMAEKLDRTLWITKGIRFESSRRLKQKDRASTLGVSILSAYVVCVTLLEVLVKDKTPTMGVLFPITTIMAPVFTLVLAWYEAGKQYLVRAERMYRSAQQIQRLSPCLELLRASGNVTEGSLKTISDAYQDILEEAAADHENVDYYYFQALHPSKFLEKHRGFWRQFELEVRGRVLHLADVWGLPLAVILMPGLLIAFAVSSLIGSR